MVRIVLHPGFHKTGTSSLQRGARARMEHLSPHLRLMLSSDLLDAPAAAQKFSANPDIAGLQSFAECFAEAIEDVDPHDDRSLLISAEDLSGYIPGLHNVAGYDATPSLMNVATAVLRGHFGDAAQITLWFTLRAARDWQRSVYWQNLRAMRLTESFDDYRIRLSHAARLPEIVRAVEARLGDRAHVTATAIETCAVHPLGPLSAVLDILELDVPGLDPLPAQNVQPEGAAEELLALNRSDLDDAALVEAKRAVVQRYRKSGETRRSPVG